MMNGMFGWLGFGSRSANELRNTGRERLRQYGRWKRLYDGWAVRNNQSSTFQWKRLMYNLAEPIINIQTDFFAGNELLFLVSDKKEKGIGGTGPQSNPAQQSPLKSPEGNLTVESPNAFKAAQGMPMNEATRAANDIWKRSGHAKFIESALAASIYGDAIIILAREEEKDGVEGKHYIRWIDPTICYPEFDPHDYDKLLRLTIFYKFYDEKGGNMDYEEIWEGGTVTYKMNDKVTRTETYDEEMFGGIPAKWICNLRVKGEQFGRSDVEPISDLIESYDHLCQKQTQIIDYYVTPNIYFKGTKKPDRMEKNNRTMYFLPENGEVGFIEWKGTAPSVDAHIERVRESISEVSATPLIAFGKIDLSSSDVSGLALKMLFGPLLKKTDRKRNTWAPHFITMIHWALKAEGIETDETDIDILWQSPLPNNTKEDWEIATLKSALGVPNTQIQREQGYTDEQIDAMALEMQVQTQQDLAKQQAVADMTKDPDPGGKGPKESDKPKNGVTNVKKT